MGAQSAFKEGMETTLLLQTLSKIGGMLHVGFGNEGAEIIAKSLNSNAELDPLLPGRTVDAIFGSCGLRDAGAICTALREDVIGFVNTVAEVVHAVVLDCGGSVSKNLLGQRFLLVWPMMRFEAWYSQRAAAAAAAASERAAEEREAARSRNRLAWRRRTPLKPAAALEAPPPSAEDRELYKMFRSDVADAALLSAVRLSAALIPVFESAPAAVLAARAPVSNPASLAASVPSAAPAAGEATVAQLPTPTCNIDSAVSAASADATPFPQSALQPELSEGPLPQRATAALQGGTGVSPLDPSSASFSRRKLAGGGAQASEADKQARFHRLGFGLHFGWAVESIVGTFQKIDAVHMSAHSSLATLLEVGSAAYGVDVLATDELVSLMTPASRQCTRRLDCVRSHGIKLPLELFTVDYDPSFLKKRAPKHQLSMRNFNTDVAVAPSSVSTASPTKKREGAALAAVLPVGLPLQPKSSLSTARVGARASMTLASADVALTGDVSWTDVGAYQAAPSFQSFLQRFDAGVSAYIDGHWSEAQRALEEAAAMRVPRDGPASFLIQHMARSSGTAPERWRGVRLAEEWNDVIVL
jgi:hypothetical protein